MKIDNRIRDILDSHDNGQFTQMCDQIKAYGIRKFFLDLYPYVVEMGWVDNFETYSKISDMFYRMTS